MQDSNAGLILTIQQWRQHSHQALKWLNHNEEKSFPKYQVYLQVFVLQTKKSLSYLLIAFPFPFGGTFCNEKRNEGGLFLTERFVNTVDFTGRADICSSWRREQKMSLINQKQNDWWPVSAANNTPLLIIQLQMKAGTQRMTFSHGIWAILDGCPWLHWEMEHVGFTHEAYLESLKNNELLPCKQTYCPCRAGIH